MTTKEQERKALEKIREIVNGLGEYSYIGSAMEGVWEIAEENIANDFATSPKDMLALRDKEIESQKAMLAELRGEIKALKDLTARYEKDIALKEDRLRNAEDLLVKNNERFKAYENDLSTEKRKNEELKGLIADLKDEIIKLKARLYDCIVREGRI